MDGEDKGGELIPLLVIAGPTAVGKSALAIRVAKAIGGEIISADSASVYRGLDVGSAKVSPCQKQGVTHYGIDVVGPGDSFSVREFQNLAFEAINEIRARQHIPMLVGGTGLWIRSVIRDFRLPDEATPGPLRQHLQSVVQEWGLASLRRQLRIVDPASYEAISPTDERRIVRALEVFFSTGHPLVRSQPPSTKYHTLYWVLTRSIAQLHQRIDERVAEMLKAGLVDEVQELLKQGVPRRSQGLSAIGYRETVEWLYGLLTESERNQLIVRHTRQFAKRQLTWFRSEKDARWLDLSVWTDDEATAKIIESVHRLAAKDL